MNTRGFVKYYMCLRFTIFPDNNDLAYTDEINGTFVCAFSMRYLHTVFTSAKMFFPRHFLRTSVSFEIDNTPITEDQYNRRKRTREDILEMFVKNVIYCLTLSHFSLSYDTFTK